MVWREDLPVLWYNNAEIKERSISMLVDDAGLQGFSAKTTGFINVLKPRGPTSHDVVARVRRATRIRRVGHTGTLDPLAEGVLVLALGRSTRLAEYVANEKKVYRATIQLGTTTTTDDSEGAVREVRPVTVSLADIETVIPQFIGTIEQSPPAFSAVWVGGRRAYDLARQGSQTILPVRQIDVVRILILAWRTPYVVLEIACGPGTYVRSLARDLGAQLGCGAHLTELTRTRSGSFLLADAVSLEYLDQRIECGTWFSLVVAPGVALRHLASIRLNPEGCTLVRNGQPITRVHHASNPHPMAGAGNPVCLLEPDGQLVAIARYDPGKDCWRPRKVVG